MSRYIDVEKLINFANNHIAGIDANDIARFPVADVAPVVHAHWNKTCVPDIYQCSACKKAVKMDELCDSEVLREFCPKCGAKMDEEDTEK